MSNQDIADFQGVKINFKTEYHEARKFMGTKGTDLVQLYKKVILLMVNAPEKWVYGYQMLADEIQMRNQMLSEMSINKNF